MSPQHDFVIDNSTGANVRADINSVLQAIASNNSGSSAPSTTYALQFYADTTNNILKLRNAANDGFINLFTLAGGVDVDAASTFSADVTFEGATSGRNIVFDKSDNALEFADNAKATFGSGADLAIYHESNHSYIQDQGTGSLILVGGAVVMQNAAQSENMFAATENSSVSLYFDNVLKLQTLSTGVDISGDLIIDGAAGGTLTLGGSSAHTSKLVIASNDGSSNGNLLVEGGDGGDFFTILSNGNVRMEDNKGLYFGADSDLSLVHDGTNSIIQDTKAANFIIKSTNSNIRMESNNQIALGDIGNSESFATFVDNDAVTLFFDNSDKLATFSEGITTRETIRMKHGTVISNRKQTVYQAISNGTSHTFTTTNGHGGGTVTVVGIRNGNSTFATTKVFPFALRSTANAGVGSSIVSVGGAQGGFSYSVAGASKGITVTNNDNITGNFYVTFDITGSVA